MWEWQHAFHISIKILTENTFMRLGINECFSVSLLGIPDIDTGDKFCFHPENCDLNKLDFSDFFVELKEKYLINPEHKIMMSAAHLYERHKKSILPKKILEIIQEKLIELDKKRG